MLLKFNFKDFFLFTFFFGMILFPTKLQALRIFLFIPVILIIINYLRKNNYSFKINRVIVILFVLTLFVSIYGLLNGYINNSIGAKEYFTSYILWPTFFTLLIPILGNYDLKSVINKLLNPLFIFLSFSILLYIPLALLNIQNPLLFYYEIMDVRINFQSTSPEFSAPFMGFFALMIPYNLINFFDSIINRKINMNKLLLTFLSLLVLIISGRRGLWLAVLVSLTFFLIYNYYNRLRFSLIIISIFLIAIVAILSIDKFGYDIQDFKSSLKIDLSQSSDYTRVNQFNSLIDEWSKNILFGNGIGSFTDDRSIYDQQPWAYELQYVLLLYQVGLVGFLIYFLSFSYIFLKTLIHSKKNNLYEHNFILCGVFTFILINSTNPYLLKLDFLWILFLPIIFYNGFYSNSKL